MEILNQAPIHSMQNSNMVPKSVRSVCYEVIEAASMGSNFRTANQQQQQNTLHKYPTCKLSSVEGATIIEHSSRSTPNSESAYCRGFNDQESINSISCNEIIDLQNRQQSPLQMSRQSTQSIQTPAKSLSDLKVQELKLECKIRSLPVSGAKPQLVERLKAYQKEILELKNGVNFEIYDGRSTGSIGSTTNTSLDEFYGSSSIEADQTKLSSSNSSPRTLIVEKTTPCQNSSTVIQHVMHNQSNEEKKTAAQQSSAQVVQLVDSNGKVLGFATVQYPSTMTAPTTNTDAQFQQPLIIKNSTIAPAALHPPAPSTTTMATGAQQQPQQQPAANYGATAVPPTQLIQKTDNIYRFSQLGSGGQFTLVDSNETDYVQEEAMFESQRNAQNIENTKRLQQENEIGHLSRPFNLLTQPNCKPKSVREYTNKKTNMKKESSVPRFKQLFNSDECVRSPVSIKNDSTFIQNQFQSTNILKQQKTNHDSPCAADQAGQSPNMPPISEHMRCSQDVTSNDETTGGSQLVFDTQETAKLLSPKTLQIHEEMLREQQKQINELMKMLGSNQKVLKEQQELILAAKKAQQKMRQKHNKQCVLEQKGTKIGEIRQINKQHIQQYLAHKAQQQQFSEIVEEHNRLHKTETRLVEELHVGTAVEDIVRLIKQDARTALLIVSLLHKYRIERDQQHSQTISSAPTLKSKEIRKKSEQQAHGPTKSNKRHSNNGNGSSAAKKSRAQSMNVSIPVKQTKEDVDMEEIFKTVIEDASRSIKINNDVKLSNGHVSTIQSVELEDANKKEQPDIEIIESTDSSNVEINQNDITILSYTSETNNMGISENIGNTSYGIELQDYSTVQSISMENQENGISSLLPNVSSQSMSCQMLTEQNQHSCDDLNSTFFDTDAFPNIDEMVARMNENDELKMNLDSDELATILGDNWLDNASRNINNHGQYEPQSPTKSNYNQEIDSSFLHGEENLMDHQQHLDWIDRMIQNDHLMNED